MDLGGQEQRNGLLVALAHDLRYPLDLIRQLSSEIKIANQINSSRPIDHRAIEQLYLTTDYLVEITKSLEYIANLESGLVEVSPLQLNNLFSDIKQANLGLAKELKQLPRYEIPKYKKIVVNSNYRVLKSILLGLTRDAMRYGRNKKSVCLRARIYQKQKVLLTVADDGVDLSERNIFEIKTNILNGNFEPVSNRPLTSSLNLLLADKLTELLGGRMAIKSGRRNGLVVGISLPASRQLSLINNK